MNPAAAPNLHLTYCLNIHPGESWEENLAAILNHVPRIRSRLGLPDNQQFGLGLRLSAQAAETLADPGNLADFRQILAENHLYVFTVNAFPYGTFHGKPVKEQVYRPDWRTPERLAFTNRVADLLAALLPEGVDGTISTVPGSYKPWIVTPQDRAALISGLMQAVLHLDALRLRCGRTIILALEPEPDCLIETTAETLAFFAELATAGAAELARLAGWTPDQARARIRAHLGVCFDTCHIALQFEDPSDSLARLHAAGIAVSKIQLSAAPILRPDAEACRMLTAFIDPVYLHQTRTRSPDGTIARYPDLDQTLLDAVSDRPELELRCHFHIPLYLDSYGAIASTAVQLDGRFFVAARASGVRQFEIETYTFAVLPAELRAAPVDESIAREYAWVLTRLADS